MRETVVSRFGRVTLTGVAEGNFYMHGAPDKFRYDIAQFYQLKAALEAVLGHSTYLQLKETAGLREWKSACLRLCATIELSANSTITVVDQEWRDDFRCVMDRARGGIKASVVPSELFASLSASLIELTFLQLGGLPRLRHWKAIPSRKEYWTLTSERTVQYVQSDAQKLTSKRVREARRQSER